MGDEKASLLQRHHGPSGMAGPRVGLRIVEAMLAIIRRTAPDRMLVTLFTGQNLAEFYGKLGFCGPESGLYGMSLRIDRQDR
jgi:hypothetical protein